MLPGPRPFDVRIPGLGSGAGRTTMQPQTTQPQTMQSQDILKLLFDALIAKQTANVPAPTTEGAATVNTSQLLQAIVAGLSGKQLPTPIAGSPAPPSDTVPPVLSPIDNWLGGEALAGKKTALSIFAYAGLAIFQALGVAGTATGTTRHADGADPDHADRGLRRTRRHRQDRPGGADAGAHRRATSRFILASSLRPLALR
ncbi:MAG: hypothetical protein ACXU8R_19635, partial [Xanthobacteraceae bacterium]